MGPGLKGVLLLAAMVLVLIGMRLAAPVLLPFLFAVFLAIVTMPLVTALLRLRAPAALAIGVALLLDLAVLAALGFLSDSSLTSMERLLPEYQARLARMGADLTDFLRSRGLPLAPPDLAKLFDPALLVEFAGRVLRGAAGLLSNLVLVLLILLFILIEAPGLRRKLTVLTGRPGDVGHLARASRDMQRYLLVKTAASAVTGLLVGLWLWAMGVDLPILWGLLAFGLNYIPTIGSILAAVPPLFVALVMNGLGNASVVAAGYVVVNFTIGNFIEPRILGRALGLSPLVVLLSVVFWGYVLGPMGALLSVPLTAGARIILDSYEDLRWVAVLLGPSPQA